MFLLLKLLGALTAAHACCEGLLLAGFSFHSFQEGSTRKSDY